MAQGFPTTPEGSGSSRHCEHGLMHGAMFEYTGGTMWQLERANGSGPQGLPSSLCSGRKGKSILCSRTSLCRGPVLKGLGGG